MAEQRDTVFQPSLTGLGRFLSVYPGLLSWATLRSSLRDLCRVFRSLLIPNAQVKPNSSRPSASAEMYVDVAICRSGPYSSMLAPSRIGRFGSSTHSVDTKPDLCLRRPFWGQGTFMCGLLL